MYSMALSTPRSMGVESCDTIYNTITSLYNTLFFLPPNHSKTVDVTSIWLR